MDEHGKYQIVPTAKQKAFLQRILTADECFHFSEVGSGKTKVILPLLCQVFLSNNAAAHAALRRGGERKQALVILVPEHLIEDARAQVFRYCLNLNFREEYRVYDDIFALLHESVTLGDPKQRRRPAVKNRYYPYNTISEAEPAGSDPNPMKQIFVTSFNQFKRALTDDRIAKKVWPYRQHVLVVADEVDDFLERDKLVFKIASNKPSDLDRPTLALYFETARAAYRSGQAEVAAAAAAAGASAAAVTGAVTGAAAGAGGAATPPEAAPTAGAPQLPASPRRGRLRPEQAASAAAAESARIGVEIHSALGASPNPAYWRQLLEKFGAIHAEIQEQVRRLLARD